MAVLPELVAQTDDPDKRRGVFTLDEMSDVPFEAFEPPFAFLYVPTFFRDPISPMDGQNFICIMDIVYIRGQNQTREDLQMKALQLQTYLETRPNDDLPGVGQIARVHSIATGGSRGNAEFIVRRLPNRAVSLEVEIWLWREPIAQPAGAS